MKVDRHGQATPITRQNYLKIRKAFRLKSHQIIWDLAYYQGERWGAILQLKVTDVYQDPVRRVVHPEITYRKRTRKDNTTRQVPVSEDLRVRLQSYEPPQAGWLFPSSICPGKHLTWRASYGALSRALKRLGLEENGYATHSTRRGFVTNLHNQGVSPKVIQNLTGHQSLDIVSRYIEVSEHQRVGAIALL